MLIEACNSLLLAGTAVPSGRQAAPRGNAYDASRNDAILARKSKPRSGSNHFRKAMLLASKPTRYRVFGLLLVSACTIASTTRSGGIAMRNRRFLSSWALFSASDQDG